ncbi:MAG: VWA domain-containing protein [Alphaproteobacteria bacterium]|nr:VWA domain-containing protein [Alphaproteobacteria bacterium]
MVCHMFGLFKRFSRDRRGNVAIIFALSLLPLAVLTGGVVDYSSAMSARTRLAQALDAAALAVGRDPNITSSEATTLATDFIVANYPDYEVGNLQNLVISLNDTDDTVLVTGEARLDTIMLGLIGIDEITVSWESEVQRARQRLELVMVLDNTGSMGGSKLNDMRDSAELLTEILFDAVDQPGDVNIGLVPFAATVNVGTNFERAWWLDPNGDAPEHGDWSGGRDANHWDLFDQMRNEEWEGCVEARPIPMDIDNTEPNRNSPETLFFPYFAPDEPDNDNDYRNDYLNDGRTGTDHQRLRNMSKYNNARVLRDYGPNMRCTTTPITPMTTNENTVLTALGRMNASGTTNIPQGVGWGIRVISPEEPFTEGTSWDDREVIKAMVILTDGENVMSGRSTYLRSDYGAYGFSRHNRLGTRSSSSSTLGDRLDGRLAAACDEAKSLGIRVYTITFQVWDSGTRDLMEACASNPTLYFNSPSAAALEDAFEMIAGDLTNLRLSR